MIVPSRPLRGAAFVAVCALLGVPSHAQQQPKPAPAPTGPDSLTFAALKWRPIGPYRGGRSVAVAGSASRPYEYWFGTTGGGVYKTIDGGNSWLPVSDKYFGGAIGAIGVSESNPDIVYVGAGEHDFRGNVAHGDGVFKTTDAGKTWALVGLADTRHIARVRVHPRDPNTVYVAALGHAYGPSAERGVFKTTDGGKTWKKILFRDDSTGATDLVVDPSNPNVLYAAFWRGYRRPWALVSGGPGGGLFKSVDGGAHWTELTRNPGLPRGVTGQIGLAVSPAKASRVWAQIEADSGGLFRSDDGGATWRLVNSDRKLRQRAWYYSRVFADPTDTNTVYALNTNMYRSSDGGKTFKHVPDPHGDNHDLWIAPNDRNRMIEGNDGGANVSFNFAKTWTDQDQATAQFYHVSTTGGFPYRVCGAQQDNEAACGPSRWPGGIPFSQWYDPGGGESGFVFASRTDPDITYAGSYGGVLTRVDRRTGFQRYIGPWPNSPVGHEAGEDKYRFQWTAPFLVSQFDPHTLYLGGNVVFKTTDEGERWTPISPDLTRNDPRTLGPSGGPITLDQTTAEYYGTVFALAESPLARGMLWAGSDDGRVHLTRDDGRSWTDVTPRDMPEWGRVSSVEASRHAPGTAYLAVNHYQVDDFAPYIYRTTDYGRTWTRIVGGIPAGDFVRVVREDPVRRGLLYAGTERGVYVSFDDGASWRSLRRNLPIVPVHDLAVKDGDLVAATHGRSFWILDDVSPLRQMGAPDALRAQDLRLFKPRDSYRVRWGQTETTDSSSRPIGRNPPSGVVMYYWLRTPKQLVTLDVMDAAGRVIRSFTSKQDSLSALDSLRGDSVKRSRQDSLRRAGVKVDTSVTEKGEEGGVSGEEEEKPWPQRVPPPPRVPNKAGLNTFVWNMRYPDAVRFTGMVGFGLSTDGPTALPGTYRVRVRAAGRTDSATFVLKEDPRVRATPAELREQFAFLMKVRDTVSAAARAVLTLRNVRAQLDDRVRRAGRDSARIGTEIRALRDRLTAVEDSLYQSRNRSGQDALNYPSRLLERLSSLTYVVGSTDARPTTAASAMFNRWAARLDTQLTALRNALSQDLARLNADLKAAGAAAVVPSTVDVVTPASSVGGASGQMKTDR